MLGGTSVPTPAKRAVMSHKVALMTTAEKGDRLQDMYAEEQITDDEVFEFGVIMLRSAAPTITESTVVVMTKTTALR